MTKSTNPIYHCHEPNNVDVMSIKDRKVLWIFDIDETLLKYNERSNTFSPISNHVQDWLNSILQCNQHAICFLTARYPPKLGSDTEEDFFLTLKIPDYKSCNYTLHPSVPVFTYTSGGLKGLHAREIIKKYLEADSYDSIYFLDDRLTQIEDVLISCSDLHDDIYGIWVSKYSYEGNLRKNYEIIMTDA